MKQLYVTRYLIGINQGFIKLELQDTLVLWSRSSTLDWKVEGSNPAAANFSFKVDDLDAQKKNEDGNN